MLKEGVKRKFLHSILVIAVTVGLLVYLAMTTDYNDFLNAINASRTGLFLLTAVVFSGITWFTDALGVHYQIGRLNNKLKFATVFRTKGASYLLNILNYNLALLGMAYYFKERGGSSFSENLGGFALITLVDLALLAMIGLIGMFVRPDVVTGRFVPFVWIGLAIGAAGPMFLKVIANRGRLLPGWIGRMLGHDLLTAFRTVTLRHLLGLMGLRALLVFEYIIMQAIFLLSFGFHVPFAYLVLVEPLLTLVGVIPISFSGIGTVQVVMRYVFSPYAPHGITAIAAVDAYSTASILCILLIRVVIGLFNISFLNRMKAAVSHGVNDQQAQADPRKT